MLNGHCLQRMEKPLDALPWASVDSRSALDRLRQTIREAIVPSWLIKPPANVGNAMAGTLKADNWRVLFEIYMPLAILSLWNEDSPIAAENAGQMTPARDTSMYLTCASSAMMKRRLTVRDQHIFRDCLRRHVVGLKTHFPGSVLPSYHMAFHIADGMDLFGPVHNASCFSGERLIGRLQDIPINHITGKQWSPRVVLACSIHSQVNSSTQCCIPLPKAHSSASGFYCPAVPPYSNTVGNCWTRRITFLVGP